MQATETGQYAAGKKKGPRITEAFMVFRRGSG